MRLLQTFQSTYYTLITNSPTGFRSACIARPSFSAASIIYVATMAASTSAPFLQRDPFCRPGGRYLR